MQILRYPLGQMQANCYMLLSGSDCLIIDPGDSADFILEEVSRRNLTVHGVVATHGHFDHIMAAGEIVMALGCPFYINPKDWFLVERLESTAQHFLGFEPQVIKPPSHEPIPKGIGPFAFQTLHTPGHTPGSTCLHFTREGILFTGDTLFANAIGRYDFSYSDKRELKQSLTKIFALPAETIVRPGHGDETYVGIEVKNMPHVF